MSITRKMLKAMGIEEEKIDQIIDAHTETVDGLKADIAKYKKDADELPTLRRRIADLEKDDYKTKYDAEHKAFEDYKTSVKESETKRAKETAFKNLLKDAKISDKRIGAILKLQDLDEIELDKDGKIKDYDKLLEATKTEWADFVESTDVDGANTSTPPASSEPPKMTKADIMKIKDTGERQKAIAENIELFGNS